MNQIGHAFTFRSKNGRLNTIKTECGISTAFDPSIDNGAHPEVHMFIAVWDTGATNSVISAKVAKTVGLVPSGVKECHTVNGKKTANTYVVNMHLPSGVGFKMIEVSEGDMGGIDVLIGMDIITHGDFAITSKNGHTIFSFRVPSMDEIDFATGLGTAAKPVKRGPKVERNDLCPCGSNKKYKHCHGR